jgi:hypothetical protein
MKILWGLLDPSLVQKKKKIRKVDPRSRNMAARAAHASVELYRCPISEPIANFVL